MKKKKILTGIKPTGDIHFGNYFGSIKEVLKLQEDRRNELYLFIANMHSLNSMDNYKDLKENTYKTLATYLACGIDPKKVKIYKQSDISQIFELSVILNNFISKNFLNNSHAYQTKLLEVKDDSNINMGLYNYPILMAADILLFNIDNVPVGVDQKQHIELSRLIAKRLNAKAKTNLKIPEAIFSLNESIIGTDGRKMSKSYNNTIPLFSESLKKIRKIIMKIETDSCSRYEKKPLDNNVNKLYKYFSNEEEQKEMNEKFLDGYSYGDAKEDLFQKILLFIDDKKSDYDQFINDKTYLDSILNNGKNELEIEASINLDNIKEKLGLL